MNWRARMLLVVVAAGGVGVAGARPATAAGTAAAPAMPTDNARPGRARFEMAETKFNLGRFEEAAADYQAAYEAEPLPAFLFNIGQCHRNLGNYERAQFYFRRYVELDPRSPNRADAEQLIAEMDRMMAASRAAAVPTSASLPSLAAPASAGAGGDDARAHAFAPTVARTSDVGAARKPLYRRPWVWIGGAAVVAAAVAAGVVLTRDDRQPSLQAIDAR
jgi:tetratricopeptide (TPR) repeat protein